MTVPVSEVYGPVLQGEGPYIGRPVWFLRLGLCNLSCSWCDTPFTWDRTRYDVDKECPPHTASEVLDRLPSNVTLVVSGGEPLMHRGNPTFQQILGRHSGPVHIETNGTLVSPRWLLDRVEWWSVSPKLQHSGDRESKRLKLAALDQFANLACEGVAGFKFVATSEQDLDEVQELADLLGLAPEHVWIMPEGTTAERQLEAMRDLYQPVVDRNWQLSPRLHVLVHDNQRGV